MTIENLDFEYLRNVGRRYVRYKWHREARQVWVSESPLSCRNFLVTQHRDVWDSLSKELNLGYRCIIKLNQLLSILYPKELNTCGYCGGYTDYSTDHKWWAPFCCISCASLGNRSKFETTMQERYGVIHALHNRKLVEKSKSTHRETMMSRHGVEYPHQSPTTRAKFERTMKERYGVRNASANAEIMAKSRKTRSDNGYNSNGVYNSKWYDVKDKFGVSHRVHGYEDMAINLLSKRNKIISYITSIQTDTTKIPNFKYTFDGVRRNYFPDMFVSTRRGKYVIEIKSPYTLKVALGMNVAKFKSATAECKKLGYTFMVMVFDSRECVTPKVLINPTTKSELLRVGLTNAKD